MTEQDCSLCGNKGIDQLCSNCTADLRLYFRYTDSTIPPLLKFVILSFSSSVTVQAEKPKVGFSRVAAHDLWTNKSAHTSKTHQLYGNQIQDWNLKASSLNQETGEFPLVLSLPVHSVYPSVCRTDGYGTDRRLQEHALFRAKNVFPFF